MQGRPHRRALLAGLAAGLSLPAVAQHHGHAGHAAPSPRPDPLAGRFGGPFSLTDHRGNQVSDRDFRGRFMLIYFGFTRCTDTCPIDLPNIAQALDGLGSLAERVVPLFVTVDPERDTPEIMKSYLGSFDPRIVGLSGDRPAIDAMIRAYRAYARKVPLQGDDYTMDHTALVYLMGKDGRFIGAFNVEQPPAQAAQEWLRHL